MLYYVILCNCNNKHIHYSTNSVSHYGMLLPAIAGFQTGSGQAGHLLKCHTSPTFARCPFKVRACCRKHRTRCNMLPQLATLCQDTPLFCFVLTILFTIHLLSTIPEIYYMIICLCELAALYYRRRGARSAAAPPLAVLGFRVSGGIPPLKGNPAF